MPWGAARVLMLSMVLVGLLALFRADKLACQNIGPQHNYSLGGGDDVGWFPVTGARDIRHTRSTSWSAAPPLIKTASRVGADGPDRGRQRVRRLPVFVHAWNCGTSLSLL